MPLLLLVAVGGADQEARLALAAVAPLLELSGELYRGERSAALVEDDGYAIPLEVRDLAAPVGKLSDFRRPRNALHVAVDQLGLRRAADLPARNDVKQHLLCGGGRRAKRPGEYRLEAVVNRARSLGDGPRAIGAAASEDGNCKTAPVGQRDETNVVGEAVERSRLVLDRSSERQKRLHPVLAGLTLGHEVKQVVPAFGLDQLSLVDAAQQVDHRDRSAGIAAVPEVALGAEKLRDGTVDTKAADAVILKPVMDGVGATEVLQQDVGRPIVAVDQHPPHQAARRNAADCVIQRAAAVVHLGKIERRYCDLDRAGHWKRRVTLDADSFAGVEVERSNADITRLVGDEGAELLLEARKARRRGRDSRLRGKRQDRQKERNDPHIRPYLRAAALTPESSPNAHIRSKL